MANITAAAAEVTFFAKFVAATRRLEGGGSGGGNKWDFLKAAASQPKGQRVQLASQPADVDAFISWVLQIRGADAASDQESPAGS